MKPAEIKRFFPIEAYITPEIVAKSIYADRNNCIGAMTLKSLLPEELHPEIDWSLSIGRIDGVPIRSVYYNEELKKDIDLYIQHANMGDITAPVLVKFIIDPTRK